MGAEARIVKLSWCFVGGGARALAGLPDGGSERQVALLASELARRGHPVNILVPGPAEEGTVSGVGIVRGWEAGSAWPRGLRFWAGRLPSLKRALRKLEPGVVYTRGFSVFAPSVAGAARRIGAPYLAALACDDDLRTSPSGGPSGAVGRAGYGRIARDAFVRLALRRASMVLSQHSGQLAECRRIGLVSEIVRNAFVPFDKPAGRRETFDACWIGHVSAFKGFDRLVELLSRAADSRLRVAVAGALQDGSCRGMLARAREAGLIEYLGEIPHAEALSVMASSKVLLNTSPAEGFSNAFLEAWYLGRPVLSLDSDPDGLLSKAEPLGICARGGINAMVDGLRRLLSDEDLRRGMGAAGRRRVESHHLAGPVVDSLLEAAGRASGG